MLTKIGVALISIFISASAFAQQNVDWSKYNHLDPEHIVPTAPLQRVVAYYDSIRDRLKNPDFISVIDFSLKNTKKRFYLIDMRSGQVETFLVAHGQGSDPQFTGYARKFSNIENSHMSSLGIYVTTQDVYNGKNGLSLRINGLEETNNLALKRAVVVHGGDYVNPDQDPVGRSEGCFVLEHRFNKEVINKISGGSLMIAWIDPTIKLDQ